MPWEAGTTANSQVFEGQVAKNTVIYSVFLTQRPKTNGICEVFSNRAAEHTGIYDGFSIFEDSRQTSTKDKNTAKTPAFLAWNISENESKNGSKITKNRFTSSQWDVADPPQALPGLQRLG